MKRSNQPIPFGSLQKSEQTWSDLLDAIAHMREALERIAYRNAPKQLAREALNRFDSSIKEQK
jgi:hypothetical protein